MKIKIGENGAKKRHITFKRFCNFCYVCGKVDHVLRECDKRNEEFDDEELENYPFGPNLRGLSTRSEVIAANNHDVSFGRLKNLALP